MAVSRHSVAVLPFLNLSSDPENEYFSDGITEEIISALTKIQGLQVTARTSSFAFKNKHEDVRSIGRQLGVETILEGSVRKAGKRVRITAQLINVQNGYHFWAENYDRNLEDIFAVQDEISLRIAEKLREHFGHFDIQDCLIAPTTQNIEAYQLYLKAKYYGNKWTPEDFRRAIKLFEDCIDLEPLFALPYAGMADVFSAMGALGIMPNRLAFEKAREFANKALQLSDQLPECHVALANVFFWHDGEFSKAQRQLERALDFAPGYSEARGLLGLYKAFTGDVQTGAPMLLEALKANPYSLPLHFGMSAVYQIQGDYHAAIQEADLVLRINPDFRRALEIKGLSAYQLGNYDEAIEIFQDLPHLPGEPASDDGWLACCYHRLGDQQMAAKLINKAIRLSRTRPEHPCNIYGLVVYYVETGEMNKAMHYLENGIKANINDLVLLPFDPLLKPLYQHPEFVKLVDQIEQKKLSSPAPRPKERYHHSNLSASEACNINERLIQFMREKRPFLDNQLCLRNLAESLDVNTNYLSQVINEKHGKNFFEFINEYRVNALKKKLRNPDNRQFTILALAFDCGFNSKTTFNTAFKRITGLTPSQYLKTLDLKPQL